MNKKLTKNIMEKLLMSLNKNYFTFLLCWLVGISQSQAAERSKDRCEFDKTDPKGDLFLVKEFGEWEDGVYGPLVATYKMTPLTRKDEKTGMPIGNFKENDAQTSEILKIIAPYKSLDQLGYSAPAVERLRKDTMGPFGFGETLSEMPCEFKNIRFCGMAEPFTQNAEDEDIKTFSKSELDKKFRRFRSLRIEHCLSNEKIPARDKESIDEVCEKPPRDTPPTDRGVFSFRDQIKACAAALKAYLSKQKNMPLNGKGKYLSKDHK